MAHSPSVRRVRRTHRSAAAVIGLLLVGGLLSACGDESGPVTITWYTNPDQGGQAAVAEACSTSDYTIEQQVLPQDAGQQRTQLARRLAAEDSGIDLMSLDPVFTAEFSNAGFLADIPDSLQQKLEQQSFQGAVDAATWEGEMVVLPFWSNTQVLWYRKDAAEAAGLDMSQPVTWEQLITAAEKLNDQAGKRVATLGVQANKYEGYVVWINALIAGAGGELISAAGRGVDANIELDSDAAREAAGVIAQLADSSAAQPDLSVSNEGTVLPYLYPRDGNQVIPEAGAFIVNWTFVYSAQKGLTELSPAEGGITQDDFENLGWTKYPRTVEGEESRPPYGGIGIGVSKFSDHPDEVMAAAECIVSPESQGINAELTGNMPASAEGYEYPALQEAYPADLLDLFQQSVEDAAPRPLTPYWSDISGAIQSSWHSPRSVDEDTPKESAAFVEDVLKGRRLL